MILPKPGEIVKATTISPRELIILSLPKVGKTSAYVGLPNHLLIDLEDGSEFVDGTRINVIQEAIKANISPLDYLFKIAKELEAATKENGGPIYDYIIIDTATALENYANKLATILYKNSQMGQSFKGSDVVTELEYGAGYLWLRRAFDLIYSKFSSLAGRSLILSGHVKQASIKKDGNDIAVKDINLTGKLKHIVCSGADAIGIMYRDKDRKTNVISFLSDDEDSIVAGTRSPHLRGKVIPVSRLREDGTLEYFWNNIFIE